MTWLYHLAFFLFGVFVGRSAKGTRHQAPHIDDQVPDDQVPDDQVPDDQVPDDQVPHVWGVALPPKGHLKRQQWRPDSSSPVVTIRGAWWEVDYPECGHGEMVQAWQVPESCKSCGPGSPGAPGAPVYVKEETNNEKQTNNGGTPNV
jgi:hypothetical protein